MDEKKSVLLKGQERQEEKLDKQRIKAIENRLDSLEKAQYDLQIRHVANGYIVDNEDEEIVFAESVDLTSEDNGVNAATLNLLYFMAYDYFSGKLGSKHTKQRVHIVVKDNEDERYEKLEKLVGKEKVDKAWAIMEHD